MEHSLLRGRQDNNAGGREAIRRRCCIGTKHYNKRSGQPSLIYRAEVNLERPGRYEMQLIGHAHPAGANGQLFSDLSGVTTALHLIEQAVVVVGVVAEVEKKG